MADNCKNHYILSIKMTCTSEFVYSVLFSIQRMKFKRSICAKFRSFVFISWFELFQDKVVW